MTIILYCSPNIYKVNCNVRVLRIYVYTVEEAKIFWTKLSNEKLRIIYSKANIVRQTKARNMRRAGTIACIREMTDCVLNSGWKSKGLTTIWET